MATTASQLDRRERMRDLLTPEQVADILQVTPRTVRRWGAAGVLERVRLGSRLTRYHAADVAALIAPQTTEAPVGTSASAKTDVAASGHEA